jgi:hypothetical protein
MTIFFERATLVSKTCDWCKKEGKNFLVVFKPKGWIEHKTSDKLELLFCSLVCFRAFTGADLAPKPPKPKKQFDVEEEHLIAPPAQ